MKERAETHGPGWFFTFLVTVMIAALTFMATQQDKAIQDLGARVKALEAQQ